MKKPSRAVAAALVGTLSLEVVTLTAAHEAQLPHVDTPDFSTPYSVGNGAIEMESTGLSRHAFSIWSKGNG